MKETISKYFTKIFYQIRKASLTKINLNKCYQSSTFTTIYRAQTSDRKLKKNIISIKRFECQETTLDRIASLTFQSKFSHAR